MVLQVGLVEGALKVVSPELDRQEYPEYKWSERYVPQDGRRMPGVNTIEYYRLTRVGAWRLLADYANNVEKFDVLMEKVSYGAEYYGASITYSNQEQDAIAFSRTNNADIVVDLTREKMDAVEEGWRQLKNKLFCRGQYGKNIFGMLNHPDVPRKVSPYRLGYASSPDDNLAVLSDMVDTIITTTNEIEQPDTILLPIRQVRELMLQRVGSTSDTSVLQYFLENNGTVNNIDTAVELAGAGPGGTDMALCYRRDPRKVVGIVPKEKTQFGPPQYQAYNIFVYWDGQVSGVHFKRPFSSLLVENV